MEVLRDSTAVTDTGSATIPGPYLNPERTESIPLKGTSASSSNVFTRCCQNCLGFADDDGLKFIIGTFFVLSAAVTVALVVQIYHGDFQVVPHGSVATDSRECSLMGSNILKENGNAVDAAVASTLCMGVVNPHITGLGGGGFMLVYDHRRRDVLLSLDFREAAPLKSQFTSPGAVGPTTVGVPGFVGGLYAAHKALGKLSWNKVVKPAADLARSGFSVPSSLVTATTQLSPRSAVNSKLHDLLDNLEAGQTLKLTTLADTLDIIASEGPDGTTWEYASLTFYNGSLSNSILAAVQGSSLTAEDLLHYHPIPRETLQGNFMGFNVIVPGAPSGGPLLLAALNSISTLNLSLIISEEPTPVLLYRLAQSIQQNYAPFFSESGDPDFTSVPSTGTESSSPPETVASHVAAVDLNDLYVSVVSGHNSLFGSQVLTGTGFILNNALASFDPASNDPTTGSTLTKAANANSTVLSSKVKLADDNLTPDQKSQAGPSLTSSNSREYPEQKLSSEQILKPTFHSVRKRRSEMLETGPRAAIWGSSVSNNGIVGGKRPISLATPVIALQADEICGRRLVLGGSDAGITAQVLSQLLVIDGNITSSIEAPRVRLSPSGTKLYLEQSYAARLSSSRLQQLSGLGLQLQSPSTLNPSVNIIEKIGDSLTSHSDSRGEGVSSRF